MPENVVVGERAWIYSSFGFIHHRATKPAAVTIGDDSGVYHGTTFVLGPDAEVRLGTFSILGGPIIATNGSVWMGDHVLVSYGAVLSGAEAGAPGAEGDGEIVIEDAAWIGTGSVLLPGARIGEGAIVGARSIVDFAVPAGSIVAGNPARVVRRGAAA